MNGSKYGSLASEAAAPALNGVKPQPQLAPARASLSAKFLRDLVFGAFCLDVRTLTFLPTNGFSIKPLKLKLKVKLLAGEQKATE